MAPISQLIRDLQRVIRKKTEKGEPIDGLNFKLQKLLEDKSVAIAKKVERKHATKYHMVKFVEVRRNSSFFVLAKLFSSFRFDFVGDIPLSFIVTVR